MSDTIHDRIAAVDPALLIIIKVWRESNGDFRAKLTHCSDLLHDRPAQSYARSRESVIECLLGGLGGASDQGRRR
jgi:hypothetical protein